MKNIIQTFLFLVLFSSLICAQSDFRDGYIITNDYDTIYGSIDYRGEIRNSKICAFIKDSVSREVKYLPGEILSYYFVSGKYYISKNVNINQKDTLIFAEYILDGVVDLYYYKDNYQEHYLIEKEGVKIQELVYDEISYSTKKGNYQHDFKKYIGTLKYVFYDYQDLAPKIRNVKLTHKSLINITRQYHDYKCDSIECIIYEKKAPRVKIRFAPDLGVNYCYLKFKNDRIFSNLDMNNSNVFPSFGLLFNISFPKWNEKLSLQYKVLFTQHHLYLNSLYDNFIYDEEPDFNVTSAINDIGLLYTYPKSKIRPILGFGIRAIGNFTNSGSQEFNIQIQDIGIRFSDQVFLPNLGIYGKIGVNYHSNNKRIYSLFLDAGISRKTHSYNFGLDERSVTSILTQINLGVGFYL